MIVITGGGTGGHVIPAISLVEEFQRRGFKVTYVGSENGIERKIFNLSVNKIFLNVAGIKGKSIFKAIKGAILTLIAFIKMLRIFMKEKPLAVIGTGGFVCIPSVIAGYIVGGKIYLQEQNAIPGASVRYLSRLSRYVFVGFEECKRFFKEDRVIVSGNPIKGIFFKENIGYNVFQNGEKLNVLVIGGSQGARFINEIVLEAIKYIDKDRINIFHQAGEKNRDLVLRAYEQYNFPAEVFGFTDNMIDYYKKAHIVIGRSGAMSVSELIATKRPAILIPFPYAIYDHQAKNAEVLKNIEAAFVFIENEIEGKKLAEIINYLYDNPQKLKEMSKNIEKLSFKNSSELIVNYILEDLKIV